TRLPRRRRTPLPLRAWPRARRGRRLQALPPTARASASDPLASEDPLIAPGRAGASQRLSRRDDGSSYRRLPAGCAPLTGRIDDWLTARSAIAGPDRVPGTRGGKGTRMRTLLLNPPSYDDFDGGAGSRYQATREVWSFWYPTWLAYPAGAVPGARLLDAPPHGFTPKQTVTEAAGYDFVVVHTSTPSLKMDIRTAEAIKAVNPHCTIAFVGGHPTARPEETLKLSEAIDIAARKEFDHSMAEVAQGIEWEKIKGISYRSNSIIHHNPDRPVLTNEQLDQLPFVTEVYDKNLDYLKYNSPYCQDPYVSMYPGRGCPARCTFCLWPQVTQGHQYRVRSAENVYEEVASMKAKFPKMKELFFDDDTFTADPARA